MLYGALDVETHLISAGDLAPPPVCVQFAKRDGTVKLTLPAEGLKIAEAWLKMRGLTIVGQNVVFDLLVIACAAPHLLPLIFEKFERGEVADTMVRQMLIDIGLGCLHKDEDTGIPIKESYSLKTLVKRHLGIDLGDVKGPRIPIDATPEEKARLLIGAPWRLRYSELDGVPLEQWPEDAKKYAIDDPDLELRVFFKQAEQAAAAPTMTGYDGKPVSYGNLHNEAAQMRAFWALHLASSRGVRTDPARVEKVCAEIEADHKATRHRFFEAGILNIQTCKKKNGVREPADEIDDDWLFALLQKETDPERRKMMEKALRNADAGKAQRFALNTKALRAKITDAYQGQPPYTDPSDTHPQGQISTSRDTLQEADDELLSALAESGPTEKNRSTYVPTIRAGVARPINAQFVPLVESGRISARKPNLTNPPRKGGIRECFRPRDGFLYGSVDYGAGELHTLSQACIDLIGYSAMAEALNAGQDLHIKLGAQVANVSYEEAVKRKKEKLFVDYRQMSKSANFGLGGGLGVPKFILFARTSCKVRFCEIVGMLPAGECGSRGKLVTWKGRPCPPICKECAKVANEIRELWFRTWPEMREYHRICSDESNNGNPIVQLRSNRVRSNVDFKQFANSYFQGLLADIAKEAFWRVTRESYVVKDSPLYGTRPVLLMHDETIAEHPHRRNDPLAVWRAVCRVAEIMREVEAEYTPDVKPDAEPVLFTRWLKGAETPKLPDGALRPCVIADCECGALVPCSLETGLADAHNRKNGEPCPAGGSVLWPGALAA